MAKKFLICDDEEGVRESLKLVLENQYSLIITESGTQCLDCLAHAKDVAIVFLDIKMPQINGLDILKEIKQRHPHIKVIMITGYKSVETAGEAVRRGASGYITKPFKSEDVLASIARNLK